MAILLYMYNNIRFTCSVGSFGAACRGIANTITRKYYFPYLESTAQGMIVLAKLTSKNQLTLPKAVTAAVEATEYFDVTTENGRVVLTPVRVNRADGVRAKLAELGLSETDVKNAVAWARSGE